MGAVGGVIAGDDVSGPGESQPPGAGFPAPFGPRKPVTIPGWTTKSNLLRQQLSDTATRMFIERGFDVVRVIEVAEACGVSDKTVFNYFPPRKHWSWTA
jgi:hypothetical protein